MKLHETAEQAFDRWILETEVSMSLSRCLIGRVVWPAPNPYRDAWLAAREYERCLCKEIAKLAYQKLILQPGVQVHFEGGRA